MRFLAYLFVLTSVCLSAQSQKTYTVRSVVFYNVENLFDTKNDTLIFDDERTPAGRYNWTEQRYMKKIERISEVLLKISKDVSKTSPDIIGLCEVENKEVLEDLVQHQHLINKDYGIVHFDSPDERGIDVALLFKKSVFLPSSFKSHRLLLFDDLGERNYTRDQLVVGGMLENEMFYFIVNHWPSRRGGATKSQPNRIRAALLNKRIIDSVQRINPEAKIISMGDLNDDPRDDSLKKILKTKGNMDQLDSTVLFNPMERLFKKGIGTLAYRDKWNLFDQFFMTPNLIRKDTKNLHYWKSGVYSPSFLKVQTGKYKGYPLRTYSGGTYTGGYSDHFPVYLFLIKEMD
ncbi:endonuclease/exonuclease/phosphatase family protein [Flagellimonas sp. 2504JD4-2]